jgi:hypothetical protein
MPAFSGLASHDAVTCRWASCTRENVLLQYPHCVRFTRDAPPARRRPRRGAEAGTGAGAVEGAGVGEREVGSVLGLLCSLLPVRDVLSMVSLCALAGSTVGSGTVKRAGAEDAVTVKGRRRLDARASDMTGTC